MNTIKLSTLLTASLLLTACGSSTGPAGHDGAQGPAGKDGAPGMPGAKGDPGAPGKDAAQSGSRIVARYVVGDDGSRQFLGQHDTQLDADCAWGTATDGKLRCLPGTALSANIYFSDAACAVPLVLAVDPASVPSCGLLPAYVRVRVNAEDTCVAPMMAVVSVGASVATPPDPPAYGYQHGKCVGPLTSFAPGPPFYTVTVIDPSSMVGGAAQ